MSAQMAKMSDKLSEALESVGATLKRAKKHRVYALPNGSTFVVGSTPSDKRAADNALSDLKLVSGVDVKPVRKKAAPEVRAERRARPGRHGEAPRAVRGAESGPSLASALRSAGVVEQSLNERIVELEAKLATSVALNERLGWQIQDLKRENEAFWSLWVVRWWFRLVALRCGFVARITRVGGRA